MLWPMMSEEPHDAPHLHPALARNTGFLLSRAGMLAQRRFAERMAEVGLNPRTWGALNVLDHEGPDGAVTQQQLGRIARIDPSSMVATIDELERLGLVERRPHPTDRRAHALSLTDAGRETLTAARTLARTEAAAVFSPLDDSERELLHGLLLRLIAGLS